MIKKAYVINLKRRTDRLIHITAECKKFGIEMVLVEAIDGKVAFPEETRGIWQAAYGCQASHLKALKLIRESGETGLILEDDCVFSDDLYDRYLDTIMDLPKDWDMFFLGGSLLWDNAIERYTAPLKRARNVLCTHSYFINKHSVDGLIKKIEEKQGKIDVIYTEYQKTNNCFIAYPELTWQLKGYSDLVDMETDNKHLKYGKH